MSLFDHDLSSLSSAITTGCSSRSPRYGLSFAATTQIITDFVDSRVNRVISTTLAAGWFAPNPSKIVSANLPVWVLPEIRLICLIAGCRPDGEFELEAFEGYSCKAISIATLVCHRFRHEAACNGPARGLPEARGIQLETYR